MKFSRVIFAIILLVIILVGIFDLPRFSIKAGDQTFTWPALDLSVFTPGSPWGNFRKGGGLYPANQFRFQAEFTAEQKSARQQIFDEDVALIRRRMESAILYDVDMATDVSGDNFQVVFTFPDYYNEINKQRIAVLLLQPGNLAIFEHNPNPTTTQPDQFLSQYYEGYTPRQSDLVKISDVAAVSIETRASLGGSVWRVKFQDRVKANLAQAIATAGYDTQTPKPLIIALDGSPLMVLVSIGQELDMLGRTFDTTVDDTELRAMSAFLLGDVGVRTKYTPVGTGQQDALYGLEGKTVTGAAMILSAVALGVLCIRRFGRRGLVVFALGISAYLLLSVAIFKLFAVSLSIGFLAGFLVMYALGALVMYDLLRTQEVRLRDSLTRYRNLGGLLMFVAGMIYVFGNGFGIFVDVLGVVAVMGMVLGVCCMLVLPYILPFIFANRTA